MGKLKTGGGAAMLLAVGFAAGTTIEGSSGPANVRYAETSSVSAIKLASIAMWPGVYDDSVSEIYCWSDADGTECDVRDFVQSSRSVYEKDELAIGVVAQRENAVVYKRRHRGPVTADNWAKALEYIRSTWSNLGSGSVTNLTCKVQHGSCNVSLMENGVEKHLSLEPPG